jgi:ferric iron reductase protein FhuF
MRGAKTMPNPLPDHPLAPLARLLARAGAVTPSLGLRATAGAGWMPANLLADPGAPLLERLVRRGAERWDTSPRVAALLTWKRYAHQVTLPVALGWACNRRVPLVEADRVRIRRDPSGLRVALDRVAVAVLPRDPCAGTPGTVVVEDEAALLAAARAALVDGHLAPVAAALRRLAPVGERPLRGSVAAALAQPLVRLASVLPGDPLTDAFELVAGIGPDLPALIDLVQADGTRQPRLRRRTCCLAWAAPGLDACESCPLRHRSASQPCA